MEELPSNSIGRLLLFGALFELGLGGIAWLVGICIGSDPLATFRWTWIATRGGILTPVIPLGIMLALVLIKNPPTQRYLQDLKEWMGEFFTECNWIQFLLLSICAGIGEEMLFRGIIQEGLLHLMGQWPALIITGVAFGMVHWRSNYYFIWATFMGMFLGALYWQSGNLLTPMICHAEYDFLILLFLRRWLRNSSQQT